MADENASANERQDGQDRQGLADRLRQRFSSRPQPIDVTAEMNAIMARALEPSAEKARQAAAEMHAAGEEHLAYIFADDVHQGRDRSTLSNQEFLEVLETAAERTKGIDQALTTAPADSSTTGSPGTQAAGTDPMRHATLGVSDANGAATRDAGTTATSTTHSTHKPTPRGHEI
jgi:hypothetical protein